jgi:3-oxoacyl-[acyl-carrier-protein] synthase II
MKMAIQGIGVTAGFGCGVDAFRTALQQGSVPEAYRADVSGLAEFIPKRALRRIDHFSKMTLLGAYLALQDADQLEADRSRMGVVIASGYGALKTTFNFLDSYLDFGYSCSSPTHFSNSVHNAAAAHVSIQLKTTAPSLTVTQFEMSVPSALLSAQQWLEEGRVDQVLFGAVDEVCDVLSYCRDQFFGYGEHGPLRPFDFEEQSAVAGEGAVFFVLNRRDDIAPYGFIEAVRLGNYLANPVTLPENDRLIIGADGHKECGRWYQQLLKGHQASSYSPLYGSFPAAAGFDLAVAALAWHDGEIYPSPAVVNSVSALPPQHVGTGSLSCLKLGPGGDYSLIRLSG